MNEINDGGQSAAPHGNHSDVEKNKLYAIIGYISVLCFVPLLAAPQSPFAKFHGKQGLVLFLTAVVLGILSQVMPGLWSLVALLDLGIFVLSIVGMLKAAEGVYWDMPVVSDIAKKFTF